MNLSPFKELRVQIEEEGKVVVLELNHGKANEIGSAQIEELEAFSSEIRGDTGICALIVHSSKENREGRSIFSAGANVTERLGWNIDQVKTHLERQRANLSSIRALPVFSIVVIDGMALGWGTEFMMAMDWRIGTPRASFRLPETGLGIIPAGLGTAELATHIGIANTLFLGMTGEEISGRQAWRMGLLNELAGGKEKGLARARQLARQVALRSPRAVQLFKKAVLQGVGEPRDARIDLEAKAYERLLETGEPAIGRKNFHLIKGGGVPSWPARDAE